MTGNKDSLIHEIHFQCYAGHELSSFRTELCRPAVELHRKVDQRRDASKTKFSGEKLLNQQKRFARAIVEANAAEMLNSCHRVDNGKLAVLPGFMQKEFASKILGRCLGLAF